MAKGGGSRDVSRRDFDLRFEERGRSSGWGVAPPSRHLWVGNLSPEVSPSVLSDQFLKFGHLEDISYVPGRSYAFVNYMKKDDAAHAMRALQGAIIEGMPLRIEFAKGVSYVDLCLLPYCFALLIYHCYCTNILLHYLQLLSKLILA